jgi:hypothetical protein
MISRPLSFCSGSGGGAGGGVTWLIAANCSHKRPAGANDRLSPPYQPPERLHRINRIARPEHRRRAFWDVTDGSNRADAVHVIANDATDAGVWRMEIVDAVGIETKPAKDGVPQDAGFVISILNGEQRRRGHHDERRRFRRDPFVAPAELEVLGDARPPRTAIFTRDANRWGIGFVTQHPLPLARDATLRIWVAGGPREAGGEMLMVRCCLLRCREVLPGWFEGAALFYHEEPRLEASAAATAAGNGKEQRSTP